MSELSNKIAAYIEQNKLNVNYSKVGRIRDHYDREITNGHMMLNTAYERALADIAGANGHVSKPQRTLRSES